MPLLALYAGQSPVDPLLPLIPVAQQRQAQSCARANARFFRAAGPEGLRAQRPDATIEIWPDASHYLFLEHPQRTADAIKRFVAGLAPALRPTRGGGKAGADGAQNQCITVRRRGLERLEPRACSAMERARRLAETSGNQAGSGGDELL
jgi:hypothetical protein